MLNVVTLIGRLGEDPELRHTPAGVAVTSFSLAVDRSYQKQGEERQTDWITVVAWRGTADFICRNFAKGRMLAVSGFLQTRKWEDREGNPRKAVEVVAREVFFCGDKPAEKTGQEKSGKAEPQAEPADPYSAGSEEDFLEIPDSDLPF